MTSPIILPIRAGDPSGANPHGSISDQTAVSVSPDISHQQKTVISAAAILDIPTPKLAHFKPTLSRVGRRFFSRCILGLKIPGKYYFISWTSSPQSPPLKKSWNALRMWLKRKRPGISWCYCMTDEGHGVIHMIARLGKGEKRLDVKEVRAHWEKLHKAKQIRIERVPEPMKNNLAAYIADQRHKKKLGGEMAWQDHLDRWRWSKGWLPKGFTKEFGRVWWSLKDTSPGLREKTITDWLNACHVDNEKIQTPPKINWDKKIEYPRLVKTLDPLVDLVARWDSIVFDKSLKFEYLPSIPVHVDPDDLVPESPIIIAKWQARYAARLYNLDGIWIEV
jgi:hypothetical protein